MTRFVSLIMSAGLLAGCQTPQSVKTLARSSSGLITETRGASPAVQQYFVLQDRHIESRIARWAERKQRAETLTGPYETLWAIDKKAEDKSRTELISYVRSNSKPAPLDQPRAVPAQIVEPASIAKMTGLLEVLANGKAETAGFYVSYWQALSKSLEDLNDDAAAAKAAPAGGGTDLEARGN